MQKRCQILILLLLGYFVVMLARKKAASVTLTALGRQRLHRVVCSSVGFVSGPLNYSLSYVDSIVGAPQKGHFVARSITSNDRGCRRTDGKRKMAMSPDCLVNEPRAHQARVQSEKKQRNILATSQRKRTAKKQIRVSESRFLVEKKRLSAEGSITASDTSNADAVDRLDSILPTCDGSCIALEEKDLDVREDSIDGDGDTEPCSKNDHHCDQTKFLGVSGKVLSSGSKHKVGKGETLAKVTYDSKFKVNNSPEEKSYIKKPNYFLALRVRNQIIHENVKKLQLAILDNNPVYKSFMVSVPTLHVTLLVLCLSSQLEVQKAIDGLCRCSTRVHELGKVYDEKVLSFSGLGSFQGQVLFAQPHTNEAAEYVAELANLLGKCFREDGIDFLSDPFHAHMTIMKLSKNRSLSKKKKLKKIPPELYAGYEKMNFGVETLEDILLCSMSDPKDQQGFYKVLASINLSRTQESPQSDITVVSSEAYGRDVMKLENVNPSKESTFPTLTSAPSLEGAEWDVVSVSEASVDAPKIGEVPRSLSRKATSCNIL